MGIFRSRGLRSGLIWGFGIGVACVAQAQYPSLNCSLLVQKNLTFFGASAGNDCWGYVSPSGREYAIVGLNNQVAYFEVTNPSAPALLAQIPHTSSTWGDIKVYQNVAYSVTETSGTGIQVVDLSQIDSGIVTLVQTIASPGRSHNLAIDTVNGFLYTCGSRDGTGTTMCFSLANPLNPVQVGPGAMTGDYQHDGIPVTYTSGPLAGKQLWFGFSEGRGVDVYDFTNKSSPVLIKRMVYPNMGYCHQGWVSEDRKYLYVDDEFDETNLLVPTRSLIFNIEDPANGFFVGTFSSMSSSIDHNQYVDDGFTFQANYRSGLRIFDLFEVPELPVQTGFFDTYPANDNPNYSGAWSCYPFLPSGNVIVSDINRGFFMIDVRDAVTRHLAPLAYQTPANHVVTGGLQELLASDNSKMTLQASLSDVDTDWPLQIILKRTAFDANPDRLRISLEAAGIGSPITNQIIEVFDWNAGVWETAWQGLLPGTDTTFTTPWLASPARFVNPTTKEVRCRIQWSPNASEGEIIAVALDRVTFDITR